MSNQESDSNQEIDTETEEGTDQNAVIEDLSVEDADATQVKGGPIYMKWPELDGR